MVHVLEYTNTVLFLGPTISTAEAKSILPHAVCLPPASCGDILQAIRLNAKIIGIIDGYYEHKPAIWHKEILFALDQGVRVYGAASLGALRAAELHEFGMVGVGEIFKSYVDGLIVSDDEVAVLHADSPPFTVLSEALVNIRFSLVNALDNGVITRSDSEKILRAAKEMFYPARTLRSVIEDAFINEKPKQDEILKLLNRFFVNQKKKDSYLLLGVIKESQRDLRKHFDIKKTIYFKTLKEDMFVRPIEYDDLNLSLNEKIIQLASKHMSNDFILIQCLARVMKVWYGFFQDEVQDVASGLMCIQSLLLENEKNNSDFNSFLEVFLKINGKYLKINNNQFVASYSYMALKYITTMWLGIERYIKELEFSVNARELQRYSDLFRRKMNLISSDAVKEWMNQYDLNQYLYNELIQVYAKFSFLILDNNAEVIMKENKDTKQVCWLTKALQLVGLYEEVKNHYF